ncbi:patatin-like phospholipase [Cotonvirus japonicus]|uniref:Patatin-like phospholipase n=1 Tax=Cotonvirus japonicus TaxID=2811091 RepID=A0ABM7NSF1_9VIRU|nr:patatin-like phospholipase [Cotonvirus japonicus]BCS83095.1 patatin-like phospholipase [Cotonvirus japonicus]
MSNNVKKIKIEPDYDCSSDEELVDDCSSDEELIDDLLVDTDDLVKKYCGNGPLKIKKKYQYTNLVLSGGSIRGISHIGAIQKMIDENLIDLSKIKAIAGASAGAVFGLFFVLGFDTNDIWSLILNIDTNKIINPNLLLILEKCGIEQGNIIYNYFEDILVAKTGIKHINFKQLYEITKIEFTVVGSCLTTKETIYFNHKNTPNFKVSVAIRISISMPVFFVPVEINKKKYIDGAILDNYPMSLFEDDLENTLGILICDDNNTVYNCFEEYFLAIINLFMHNYYRKTSDQYVNNTIYVNKSPDNVFVFNFNLDDQTKHNIYNCGIEAANNFIQKLYE